MRMVQDKKEEMLAVQTETHIYGIMAIGRRELLRHLKGEKLTHKQAILAKCYDCTCRYYDGKKSCPIPECSLFPFMPYRSVER